MRMQYGFRYELIDGAYDGEDNRYRFAEPVEYADGSCIGDCWITDRYGNVHPGYNISPVPVNADNLINPQPVSRLQLTLEP